VASASSNSSVVFTPETKDAFSQYLLARPNERRITQEGKEITIEWLTNLDKRPYYVQNVFTWDKENQTLKYKGKKDQTLLAAAKKDRDEDRTVVTTDKIADIVEDAHTESGHGGWDATWKRCPKCAGNPSKRSKGSAGTILPSREIRMPQNPPTKLRPVEQWNESRDIGSVYNLWTQRMDVRFAVHVTTLAALLCRPRHYVVRDSNGQLLGFCATFLSYVDQAGEKLIASLAILLVDIGHQYQGIGLSLHNHAIDQLKKTRGVCRLQLGSTFPRILYGPPFYMEFDQTWFSRRGWQLDREDPGQGQPVYDMLLDFAEWNQPVPVQNITFSNCANSDMGRVLQLVGAEMEREHKVGWLDQYSKLAGDPNVKDIVVGIEAGTITAVALIYTPLCCSPVSLDLPWGGQIGDDVGGVTCICIPRKDSFFNVFPNYDYSTSRLTTNLPQLRGETR
jgi:hypothetical protein